MGAHVESAKIDRAEVAALVERLREDFIYNDTPLGEYDASNPEVVKAAIKEIREEDPEARLVFSVSERSTFLISDVTEEAADAAVLQLSLAQFRRLRASN